jgi:hypothetical protein
VYQSQVLERVLADLAARPAGMARGDGQLDVAERAEPRHQRVALEDDGAVEARTLDVLAGGDDGPGCWRIETRQDVENG